MKSSRHLHVLHIASGDLWAGAEVQLYTLIKALKNMPEISVSVVLFNHGRLENKLLELETNVIVLDENKLSGTNIFFRLRKILSKLKPDLVHTHRFKENILGSFAAFFAGRLPSIRTTHGGLELPPPWTNFSRRSYLALDKFCGRYLQNKIISVSDELTTVLSRIYTSSKVVTIENGVDIESLQKLAANINRLPPANDYHVGIVGRLTPIKRVDIFIETARYMLDHYPEMEIRFHIFGDGPLLEELIVLSKNQGIDSIVTFEGHSNDIVKHLLSLNALIMCSDHEGLPMVLLEAMTLKTPVIAHGVGGITKLLDHGNCGILVQRHDAEDYAQKLHNLLTNTELQTSICEKAFARITEHYSAEDNARAYIREYSSIVFS